jgi:glutaredoxin
MTHRLTFYTRVDCHLCVEALAAVERVRKQEPCELELLDLDAEALPEKLKAYDWEVPVVELDGRKIMKYTVDEARLLRLLRLP